MDFNARLRELAKQTSADQPIVSVYLNTRWADEHQRDRVRLFLKNEIRKARQGAGAARLEDDLRWIETQGEALARQSQFPDASGVALFACQALGLREILPLRVPFDDAFVVDETPFLRPLATLLERTPSAVVVFVDGESARLVPVDPESAGDELTLQSEVQGQHRRGGWALLAQSRYERHIAEQRGRHFEAVAAVVSQLTEQNGFDRIVLAGEPKNVALFRKHLPAPVAARVAGSVAGSRYEPAAAILGRATELLARLERDTAAADLEDLLTEAAKGGQAVAGLEETLDAVERGAVRRLYLLAGFRETGRVCAGCASLQRGDGASCRLCGKPTKATELGEAIVDRVIAAGGKVETVERHGGLERVGGVAARLRYAL